MTRRALRSIFCMAVAAVFVAGAARAAVFTVGPSGAFATLQAGIDAALAAGGANEVRVQEGTFFEEAVTIDLAGGALQVLGGWDASFVGRIPSPAGTVVDARGHDNVMTIFCRGGELTLEGMTLTHGGDSTFGAGAGARMFVNGGCATTFRRMAVSDNKVVRAGLCLGGGISATVQLGSSLALDEVEIQRNRLDCTTGDPGTLGAAGGGLDVRGESTSLLRLSRTLVAGNDAVSNGAADGAGIAIRSDGDVEIADTTIRGNEIVSPAGGTGGLAATVIGRLDLRRLEVVGNACGSSSAGLAHAQLAARKIGDRTANLSDSLIAAGAFCAGAEVTTLAGDFLLTNVTAARNAGDALRASRENPSATGSIVLANDLVFGNGSDVPPSGPGVDVRPSSSFGVDPLFVDPTAGNFHLLPGSPAIDSGDDAPIGGLGAFDLDRGPRRQGLHVDRGAYEAALTGRVHRCDVPGAGSSLFVPYFLPVCRCISDPSLNATHCGFLFPELFLDVLVADLSSPGVPTPVDWSIDPWHGGEGAYQLTLEMLDKGQWVPMATQSGKLKLGKLEKVHFTIAAPFVSAPLRARVRHQSAFADKLVEDVMDVALAVKPPGG